MQKPDTSWLTMSLPAKWKHAKAGHAVPVSLAEVDRLEAMFGGEPNSGSPEATLFWTRAATRRGDHPVFSHELFVRADADQTP